MSVDQGLDHDPALKGRGILLGPAIADGSPVSVLLDEPQAEPIGIGTQAAEGANWVEVVKAGIGGQGHGHAFLPDGLKDCVL